MNKLSYILLLALSISLSACYSSRTLSQNTESSSANNELKSQNLTKISIMHVDLIEKIITLKSYTALEPGFYNSIDPNGNLSATFKLSRSESSSLYEADILEGNPNISDSVVFADTQ